VIEAHQIRETGGLSGKEAERPPPDSQFPDGQAPDRYLLALTYVEDIGPVTIKKLVHRFGSAQNVFAVSLKELMQVEGVHNRKALKGIKEFSRWTEVERDLEKAASEGARIVFQDESGFPPGLANLPDAPLYVYMKGDVRPEDRFAVAVVGTRTPTHYGTSMAESISSDLARMGITVVSGLARGVDTAAHKGALKAGGRTIGVMGSGIDVPYPPENKALMGNIAASGCVISEFAPGTPPNRENFPRRNRIISGLSLGVLVVEAAKDSGSLITASIALEQGKEVFSVPGNITSVHSKGTNDLIKQGARMVTCAQDILEELAPVLRGFIARPKERVIPSLTEEEKSVVGALGPEPRHVDEISRELGLRAASVLGVLLTLELKGVVKQAAGKKFFIC
jgi:DNA processing protein